MAPALARTALQGTGELKAHWDGGWQQQGKMLQIDASLQLPRLVWHATDTAPQQAWRINDLRAEMTGSLSALHLTTRAQFETGTRRFALQAQARGGRRDQGAWQATLDHARLDGQNSLQPGTWTLQLSPGVVTDWRAAASGRVLEISEGQANLTGPVPGTARLNWQPLRMSLQHADTTAWRTQGQVSALPLGWLALLGGAQMANLGLRGDMVLGGQWEAVAGDSLRLRASLARTSGDLSLQAEDGSASPLSAGVREASVTLNADGEALTASLRWDSERAGQAQATLRTRLLPQDGGWSWPADTPVSGSVRARLPRVGVWSVLAPPGWRLRGTLDADATLSGTRAAPQWSGTLRADDLAVRSVVDGIEFSQGTLRASLNGQRLDIDTFSIKGASGAGGTGGLLTLKGFVLWPPAQESATPPATTAWMRLRMELDAEAQALRVSARADRRLAVSGKLSARLTEARLAIRGTLKADQALIVLPEDTAPTLGEDVVVRSSARPSASTLQAASTEPPTAASGLRVTPDIALTLDLGPDFRLRGRGLVTRLAGQLALSSNTPGTLQPRLVGDINTLHGTYKAYGQQLDIEEGVLRFSGPFDNPALDVRAVRPNLTQRVGVQITGTALSPRVRLFSEPELPDAEKLAWLVLGRGAASGGAESAVLQQAALALLGGNGKGLSGGLADALGLDEVSVRGATSATDNATATGATVTLGKRLSRDFYVAYERSLTGTLGTFYIFYDLSRRFTLRAQTGEHSAVDLIFTQRYD
jgi:translocation and assembly module TamB